MIALILILFAAFCKSIADTIRNKFDVSVFRKLPERFWNPAAMNVKPVRRVFNYPVDAWHLLNSGMIVSFIVAAVIHRPLLPWYFEIPIAGVAYNIFFQFLWARVWHKK